MGKNVKCLLIDDDIDDHEIFKLALETIDESILCTCIDKSIYAIEKLKTDESFIPSIIFVDINMPVMDGWEFMEEIKKIKSDIRKDIHIYIVSSSIAVEDKNKSATFSNIMGYIPKPISVNELIAIVSNT